jgi:hypothetical protein
LLKNLLKKNPMERMSFEEFFTHQYFQGGEGMSFERQPVQYLLPNRQTSDPEAIRPSRNSMSSRRSSGEILLNRKQDEPLQSNLSQSVSSLSSSSTSIPPFARLSSKFGTPPSRASGSIYSAKSFDANSPSALKLLRHQAETEIIDKFAGKDNFIQDKVMLILTLVGAVTDTELSADRSSLSLRDSVRESMIFSKISALLLIELCESLQSSPVGSQSQNFLSWLSTTLDLVLGKVSFACSSSMTLTHTMCDTANDDMYALSSIYFLSMKLVCLSIRWLEFRPAMEVYKSY